jgi:hypothetical protein
MFRHVSVTVIDLILSGLVAALVIHYDSSWTRLAVQYAAAEGAPKRRPAPTEGGICAKLRVPAGTDQYCVSSVLPQDNVVNRFNYGPESLFDNANDTAWVEGVSGQGIGQWIVVEFDQLRLVMSIEIINGYNKDRDIYLKNSRVKEMRIEFSDREKYSVVLKDTGAPQPISLPQNQARMVYWIKFTIESVYPGNKYDETAISELHIVSEPAQP